MSNFVETFKLGKLGKNFGLTTGIPPLDIALNGIQKKASYGLAAAPKTGKTTLVDYAFVLSPYLQCIELGILDNIEWIYLSGEIDRVSKEFKFASFFMWKDYGIANFTYKGKLYPMTMDYLMGIALHKLEGNKSEIIPITEEHEAILKQIYVDRIVPLFGEYNAEGEQVQKGKIIFIEELQNPTGLNKMLIHHAEQHGKFVRASYYTKGDNGEKVAKTRITGYIPDNPDKFTFIITDHIRKLPRERGFTMKENIDKWLEYATILRNRCSWTFAHVMHSNRNLANPERLRYAGEFIFPTADDCKDSGNPAEECTVFMTLFNPNDEKYNLKKHFGVELADYPNYRSIHITESRNTECPVHIQTNMVGGINVFTSLNYGI